MVAWPNAQTATLERLEWLVSFDITSRNSNWALIDFVRSYLKGLGMALRICPDDAATKADVHAVISSIVCGPGSIREARQPDEWIARDQISACDELVRRAAAG